VRHAVRFREGNSSGNRRILTNGRSEDEHAFAAAYYTLVESALVGFAAANRAASSGMNRSNEQSIQSDLFRDIFGKPFRPVAFNHNWRTSDVVAMCRGMYDTRDFSAMPILADALQDAGCDNADVLGHCRSTVIVR
jgi:hypothetical protein